MGTDLHGRRVHFIGIGGYSMSGLALALHDAGCLVTGSDAHRSSRTERLAAAGIPIAYGHDAANVGDAEWVVYNTDVPETNPERRAAVARGLQIRHRSEILADLLSSHAAVLVTGTHGKTTTTSMIGLTLARAGLDPLVLVGGEVDDFGGGNVALGRGTWAVAEADESDGSFLRYRPTVAVVTNLEAEHLEHYDGRFENVRDAMRRFLLQVPPEGVAVLSAQDPVLVALHRELPVPVVTFGAEGDVTARDVRLAPEATSFVAVANGDVLGEVRLMLPGRHNVDNALAAVAVSRHVGVDFATVQAALAGFRGVRRRFQEVLREGSVRVVDDYAVHPTEIRATLAAARQTAPARVIAVWQPHRAYRLRALWDEFATALDDADVAIVTDLYAPAGEPALPGVDSRRFVDDVHRRGGGSRMVYGGTLADTALRVAELVRPNDLIITLGAGDIWRLADLLRGRLEQCAPST